MFLDSITPTSEQHSILSSTARIIIATGSIRSGKTMVGCATFARNIMRDIAAGKSHPLAYTGQKFNRHLQARLTYWCVAPTHKKLKQSRAYLLKMLEPWKEQYLTNEDELWLRTDAGFVLVAFLSAERPDLLVGERVDGVMLDEAARAPRASWEGALYGRLSESQGFCVMCTSPLGRNNWVYELINKGDPDIASFNLYARDNPKFPRASLVAAKRQLTPVLYKREFLGSWENAEIQVFHEWDIAKHVVSEAQIRLEYGLGSNGDIRTIVAREHGAPCVYYGADWGDVTPTALVVAVKTVRGEYLVVEEWVRTRAPLVDESNLEGSIVGAVRRLSQYWGRRMWQIDITPGYGTQLQTSGVSVQAADKRIEIGVRLLSTLLHGDGKRPRLRVLAGCKHVVTEMGALAWRVDRDGRAIDGEFDPKVPNDATDALRYGLMPIRSEVFDKDGIPRVLKSYNVIGMGAGQGYVRG